MKKGKRYLFLLVGLALLWIGLTVACETEPPVILRFSSSPAEISTGESATLSWVVKDATSVSINHGVGVVENVGNKKVSPSATITYTLIATNSGGAVSKSVVVIVSATSLPSPDTSPPVISGVDVSNITDSSARVTWTTDELATGRVEYGLTESYGSATPLDNNLIVSHGVTISGLSASTTYHFKVKSKDANDNETADTDRTFITSTAADITPPVISAVNTSGTTQSSATITWTTNEAATSQVMYGATTSYGSTTPLDTNLVTSHSVILSGLSASTTYHFKVKSRDASGNESISGADQTFMTLAPADTMPPVIAGISSSNITESSVVISWTTNEVSSSQVEYGANSSYGSTSPLNTNLNTNHSVTLTGLAASTTYHYRVKSKDNSGNEAISVDQTFATLKVATDQWVTPISAVASGYTKWGGTWYTGPPEFAIDGNSITAWTLNAMGEITFDLGSVKKIKGIEAYWQGSVTNGNTVNVFIDNTQVLGNEKFGATSNKRYFTPVQGRYIKYQTVALPHNEYLQVASWSEIAEFKVLVESE